MIVLKRPPYDDFTFRLFYKLTKKFESTSNIIYIWSAVLDPSYTFSYQNNDEWCIENEIYFRKKLMRSIDLGVIILGIKDHLTSGEFNPYLEKKPNMINNLNKFLNYYSDKKIILFSSLENLESYIDVDHVKIVKWGGDLTNQWFEYKKLAPVLDKNLSSEKTFLSLNRNSRAHRAAVVSLIYGLGLQNNGLISCMFKDKISDIVKFINWNFSNDQIHIKTLFQKGFNVFEKSILSITDERDIYKSGHNDNITNFKNKLTEYYKNTFVEIISETSYTESCFLLTEKTLNSIYGCNFPIIICSQNSVEFLRNLGMDMFDDVIDHSYDKISDPIDRLYSAIVDNIELLTNNENTKKLWLKNRSRFLANIEFAKKDIYDFYTKRAEREFEKAVKEHRLND